jgi:hypothetical protein
MKKKKKDEIAISRFFPFQRFESPIFQRVQRKTNSKEEGRMNERTTFVGRKNPISFFSFHHLKAHQILNRNEVEWKESIGATEEHSTFVDISILEKLIFVFTFE